MAPEVLKKFKMKGSNVKVLCVYIITLNNFVIIM